MSLGLLGKSRTFSTIHDTSKLSQHASISGTIHTVRFPCPNCTMQLGKRDEPGLPTCRALPPRCSGPHRLPFSGYSLNRVQGWACRRPGALRMVLQEVDHCLPDCPQLPVSSYKSKSGSWLWQQVLYPSSHLKARAQDQERQQHHSQHPRYTAAH